MSQHGLFQTIQRWRWASVLGFSVMVGPAQATWSGGLSNGEKEELPREASPEALRGWLEAAAPEQKLPSRKGIPGHRLAPRHHGLVCEAGLGATGYTGAMGKVSPSAPLVRLGLGYEVTHWLLLGAFADLSLTDTRYASRQLNSRAYALGSAGLGLRLSWALSPVLSLTAQGDAGFARVDEPVLQPLGYRRADQPGLQFSAIGGLEWHQASPHHAIRFFGGMREFRRNFRRLNSSARARAWLGGIGLRYAL